jgi:hypothetical protein
MFLSCTSRNAHLPPIPGKEQLPPDLHSQAALDVLSGMDRLKGPHADPEKYERLIAELPEAEVVALAEPLLKRGELHWQEARGDLLPKDNITRWRIRLEHRLFGSPYPRLAELVLAFAERLEALQENELAVHACLVAERLTTYGQAPELRFSIGLLHARAAENIGDRASAAHERLVSTRLLGRLELKHVLDVLSDAFNLHTHLLGNGDMQAADALLTQIDKVASRWYSVRRLFGQSLLQRKAQQAHDRGDSDEALNLIEQAFDQGRGRERDQHSTRVLYAMRGQIQLEQGRYSEAELDLRAAHSLLIGALANNGSIRPSKELLEELKSVQEDLKEALSRQGKISEWFELQAEFPFPDDDDTLGV